VPSDKFEAPSSLKEGQEIYVHKTEELAKLFDDARDGDSYDYSRIKQLDGKPVESHQVADRVKNMNAEIADLGEWVHEQREAASTHDKLKKLNEDRTTPVWTPPQPEGPQTLKSFGEFFVNSEAFKNYKGGDGPEATYDINAKQFKTLMTTAAGWAPENIRIPRVELDPQRPIAIADRIPTLSTTQAAVVYMEETTFTNNAAEASEGAAFGEAALVLTERTSTVRKIAVQLPITDEQLEDVSQVEDYVNQRLSYMIRARLDGQIIAGNGTAPNLEGTNNVTGINTTAKGSDPTPDAVYKSIRKCRATGFAEPSVVFVHPNDWEDIRLLRDVSGNYIWGPPSAAAPEQIWGVPVTVSAAVTENTITLGDYAGYAALYLRRGIDLQVGYTGSQFVEGEKTIRATMRVALVHFRPEAFATVTGV
jgi:HK97 family phage major capsid protein